MKKKVWRIVGVLIIAILSLWPFVSVHAVPSDITWMTANPSDTYIILTWVKGSTSDNVMIRYRTDMFPTDNADGEQAYFGTAEQTTVGNNSTGEHGTGDNITALAPGQVYYFAIWAKSGATWSVNPFYVAMSTLAVSLPSGAQDVPSGTLPSPTMPNSMTQAPNPAGFDLRPFSDVVTYFNSGPGGLGMPVANAWETLAILGIVAGGFGTYVKIRNFFVAFAVVFILTLFCIGLQLVQGYLLGIELVIGAGVWGVEHYLQ